MLFCLETQYRLLESAWPAEVLNLPSCKEVTATDGSLLFRGPRVRMGIHWAGEGTVAHRYFSFTLLLYCTHWAGQGTIPQVLPILCCHPAAQHVYLAAWCLSNRPYRCVAAGRGNESKLAFPVCCRCCMCLLPRRLHLLTKHRVFSGPGFLVAQEIGDAAHGGQVAVSHDAWLELRNNMDQVTAAGRAMTL